MANFKNTQIRKRGPALPIQANVGYTKLFRAITPPRLNRKQNMVNRKGYGDEFLNENRKTELDENLNKKKKRANARFKRRYRTFPFWKLCVISGTRTLHTPLFPRPPIYPFFSSGAVEGSLAAMLSVSLEMTIRTYRLLKKKELMMVYSGTRVKKNVSLFIFEEFDIGVMR